ncbi:MAG: glycosyltransferase [Candidatus Eisenbacteria bacterium]|uniref:Glycosyltransferase n=1 Tax=Eiseniibacteriota bacterium TaxID=2212470 RepID=A0A948RWE9_UNCEI|nr:glycosyltransferase [Candidatus Eisenbacteria bacterium]MBU1947164.1 glycosyltransferase [Candidatus Eisenbacteria bacterium]MBU2691216.1 glycosyltransferase [Candidatus Eisenbacteria bacterium]
MSAKRHPILLAGSTFVTGGAERILYYLAKGLNRPPFQIELLALRELGEVGEEIRDLGIPAHSELTGSGRMDPLVPFRIARLLRQGNFEAIYFLDHPHAVFYTTLASFLAPARVRIVPVHSMGLWGGRPSVRRPIRLVMPWIKSIVTIAEAQKEYLHREEGLPVEKMTVIYNGISLESPDAGERARQRAAIRVRMGVSEKTPVIGIIAVLRPEKNHEMLFEALSTIRKIIPDAELWVIGGGTRRKELERVAGDLGLDRAIRFLGLRRDARELMAGLDVAVLSSHPRVETLPLSLLEAMDKGIPVVATRVGALAEMIEDGRNGLLVPHGDAGALAAALTLVLKDPEQRKRMGEEGQKICREKFTVEQMIDATGKLLCDLLKIDPKEWTEREQSTGESQ